ERELFSEDFLIKRPLLQSLEGGDRKVLLIDELDRADEEFEGYLLEMLSDFQITVPEVGTYAAESRPVVVITSNRTREIHDALKRRCLYYWIDYPDLAKETEIVRSKAPEASGRLAGQVTAFVQELRGAELYKVPGVAETLDWTAALVSLNTEQLTPEVIDETLGVMLKYREDVENVRGEQTREILARAQNRGAGRGGRRG
ncbi:MAG: MoxR family ATPase, partial [Chloroflexota bacterium]|nr:MoxR family ATPase [Chloroflexota bacterium]